MDISLDNVDWALLREQKCTLINEITINENSEMVCTANHLNGILHFIDHVQDQAAEVIGAETVFGSQG